jgi:hypothetical protein
VKHIPQLSCLQPKTKMYTSAQPIILLGFSSKKLGLLHAYYNTKRQNHVFHLRYNALHEISAVLKSPPCCSEITTLRRLLF